MGTLIARVTLDTAPSWEDVEALFAEGGIRIASYEEPLFAAISPSGEVLGALVAGISGSAYRFSVAVAREHHRRGIGRFLVRALLAYWKGSRAELEEAHGSLTLEAWVVNPDMGELLRAEGFEEDSRGWSPERPHMWKD